MENISRLDDGEVIAGILRDSFITVAKQFNFTPENAPHFPAFISSERVAKKLGEGLVMYGYSLNGVMAGCAGYSHFRDKIWLIERLATLPGYRHLGIGGKLMDFIEGKILEKGGEKAEIHVVDINIVLIKWYKKMGYTVIRTDEINWAPFNSCVMNKNLK